MARINRAATALGLTLLFSVSLAMFGCSSSPDEAQMKQLNDLKEEVARLQKDVAAKEQQQSAAEKDVADKNAKLKKCNDDQVVVKQRLAK